MSSSITKVAIAGATGNLGPSVLKQLLEDGFKVTVLTRKGATHTFPPSVTTAEIDYNSPESLEKALSGQDAVVSTVGFGGLSYQPSLVQAAVKVGVKRFIPSEFGGDAENEKTASLPPLHAKKAVTDLLKKEAAAGSITYTSISTGPFLDMAVQYGIAINVKGRKITLWDGGDRPISMTTIAYIAKAVSEVLKHPEETKNRNVHVHNVNLTLKELLEQAKKVVGPEGWTSEVKSTEENLKHAYAELEKGGNATMQFLVTAIFGEGYGSDFKNVDNKLLGIKEFTGEELQDHIKRFAN
ncbi:NAD(P)-binding protein [Daldinia caldariorum]|uniref:NAD(P)-binding protein n=1 Tax=Daldinia caldariorum TaxID=326644 RepID=UPI0020087FD8|nr:NAD(P)-binding protein [Daldinia caldariorum]KAI1466443.1 NAD(P)-binding protein [Daldinia caldariorum]